MTEPLDESGIARARDVADAIDTWIAGDPDMALSVVGMGMNALDNLDAFFAGKTPPNLVA